MIIVTSKVHPWLLEKLSAKGFDVHYHPDITYNELEVLIPQAVGLVVTTRLSIDRQLLERAQKLMWIGRLGSGMELIDTGYDAERSILCVSSPEGNRNAVAEHCLGMLLSLSNRINLSSAEVKSGLWKREENRGEEITGKTVGIIGYGNTGEAFSKLLQCLGVTILAYDRFRFDFGKGPVKEASMEQICRYADVISFHVPLNADSRHMAGKKFFSALERKPYIINSSRGQVVDTASLLYALENNLVRGAALDVLENERLESYSSAEKAMLDKLLGDNRVLITPHIAGYSQEAFLKMSQVMVEKLGLD